MGSQAKDVEIVKDLNPKKDELCLLDNHSLLNLFNILERQLEGLNALLYEKKLKAYSQFCLDVLIELSDGELAKKIPGIKKRLNELGCLVRSLMEDQTDHLDFFRGIIETIEVAQVRLEELGEDRLKWIDIPCSEFRGRLNQFLTATERVSRGNFHFTYPPEKVPTDGYRIVFKIPVQGESLKAPPILHDTIRDIVGNARKYSPKGTEISILLEETKPAGIRLTVSDQGIGIPEDELEKVVEYGYRASNALDRNTMGGGLGLTKAYLLTRKYDGHFNIKSSKGKGTTIKLSLSQPS